MRDAKELLGFRIERVLASDGVVETLLGRNSSDKQVILKVVHISGGDELKLDASFIKEAEAYSRLRYLSIVELLQFSVAAGRIAMAFEHVDGVSLNYAKTLLIPPLDDVASVHIARGIFSALGAAHSARRPEDGELQPVIHRDLNPLNIFLSRDGEVKVADFGMTKIGVVRAQGVGAFEGTVGYMAPEQIRGETLTPSADVYAASLIIAELFAANSAAARSGGDIRELALNLDDSRPDLSVALRALIARGLSPDPERREMEPEEAVFICDSLSSFSEGQASLAQAVVRVQLTHAASVSPTSLPPDPLRRFPPPLDPRAPTRSSRPPPFSFPPPETYLADFSTAPRNERAPVRDLALEPLFAPRIESLSKDRVPSVVPPPRPFEETNLDIRQFKPVPAPSRAPSILVFVAAFLMVFVLGLAFVFRERIFFADTVRKPISMTRSEVDESTVAPVQTVPSISGAASAVPDVPAFTRPAASSTSTALPVPSAAVASAASSNASSGEGVVRLPPRARGHRIYIDEKLITEGSSRVKLKCGSHALRIGTRGKNEIIDVPCNGTELVLK